jgi:pimeloyl-ACP methyl ester carboxylesterase
LRVFLDDDAVEPDADFGRILELVPPRQAGEASVEGTGNAVAVVELHAALLTLAHPTTSTWPGPAELQLDLFGDYKSNVALYPTFQKYFRTDKPPFLAVWGRYDPFFLPQGADAFTRDIPDAVVRFFDTGHFALETHSAEIAAIRDFLPR